MNPKEQFKEMPQNVRDSKDLRLGLAEGAEDSMLAFDACRYRGRSDARKYWNAVRDRQSRTVYQWEDC